MWRRKKAPRAAIDEEDGFDEDEYGDQVEHVCGHEHVHEHSVSNRHMVDRFGGLDEEDDDEANESEHEPPARVWDYASASDVLRNCGPEQLIDKDAFDAIADWLDQDGNGVVRQQAVELRKLLAAAKRFVDDGDDMPDLQPKKKRTMQPGVVKSFLKSFATGHVSDADSDIEDPDQRLGSYPMAMAPITNRSHVHGIDKPAPPVSG